MTAPTRTPGRDLGAVEPGGAPPQRRKVNQLTLTKSAGWPLVKVR